MRASFFGAALLGAAVVSCGPPPQPTSGRLIWSFACDTSVMGQPECGNAPESLIEGITRRTPAPELSATCYILANGANVQFRVVMEQTQSNGSKFGVSRICGTTTPSGGVVANSLVTAQFGAAEIRNVGPGSGTAGGCDVRVTEVSGSAIKGQFRCARVADNSRNYRRINGVSAPSTPATADAEWAEFSFTNCFAGTIACTN